MLYILLQMQRKSSSQGKSVVVQGFRIPVNQQENGCDKWVQTRGYRACVFNMPIPLRVCLTGVPTNRKLFFLNYGNKKHPPIIELFRQICYNLYIIHYK